MTDPGVGSFCATGPLQIWNWAGVAQVGSVRTVGEWFVRGKTSRKLCGKRVQKSAA
jgi:hypothetical protein